MPVNAIKKRVSVQRDYYLLELFVLKMEINVEGLIKFFQNVHCLAFVRSLLRVECIHFVPLILYSSL